MLLAAHSRFLEDGLRGCEDAFAFLAQPGVHLLARYVDRDLAIDERLIVGMRDVQDAVVAASGEA